MSRAWLTLTSRSRGIELALDAQEPALHLGQFLAARGELGFDLARALVRLLQLGALPLGKFGLLGEMASFEFGRGGMVLLVARLEFRAPTRFHRIEIRGPACFCLFQFSAPTIFGCSKCALVGSS